MADRQKMRADARTGEDQRIADFRWVASTPQGRRFLYRVLEVSGVFHTTFNPDPYQSAFNEGGRNAGLRVLNDLMTLAPGAYAAMLDEHAQDTTTGGD